MKKSALTLVVAMALCSAAYAQEKALVEIQKSGLGTVFLQGGQRLTPKQLLSVVSENEQAYALMKKARGNYDASTVIGFVGGFLVGWPLGTAIGGGDPAWGMAAIGACLVAVSIPFASAYTKNAREAVSLYNAGLSHAYRPDYKFDFQATHVGLGVRMRF